MIQLQRNYRNESTAFDGEFSQSDIRSYQEYLSLARIPTVKELLPEL